MYNIFEILLTLGLAYLLPVEKKLQEVCLTDWNLNIKSNSSILQKHKFTLVLFFSCVFWQVFEFCVHFFFTTSKHALAQPTTQQ